MELEAVFLDVDGTLTKGPSCWQLAHRRFGVEEQANRYYELAMRKEIDYDTWARLDVELWKGRSFEELCDALLPPRLLKGVKESVQAFVDEGVKVVLVSGGINVFVDAVKEEVGADLAFSNIIREEGGLIKDIEVQVGTTKQPIVERVANDFGIDLSRSGCIGDHYNDLDMFKAVGYPIAFNPKTREIERVALKVVRGEDFRIAAQALLDLVNGSGYFFTENNLSAKDLF